MGKGRLTKLLLVVGTSVAMLGGVGLAYAAPGGHATPTPGPTALTATVGRNGMPVNLKWTTGLETADTVERSLQPDHGFAPLAPAKRVRRAGARGSYHDKAVTWGTRYYYRVAGATSTGTVYSEVLPWQVGVAPPTTGTTPTTIAPPPNTGGQPQWWQGFGDDQRSRDIPFNVVSTPDGGITFSSGISSIVNFGPADPHCVTPPRNTNPPRPPLCAGIPYSSSIAIVHETANGTAVWQRTMKVQSANIAVDRRNGDIVIAGTFIGSVDFGAGLITSQPADLTNVYVARYTKDNALVRVAAYHGGAQSWANPTAVAVGPAGEVVLTGYMVGTFDFGAQPPARSANDPSITGQRDLFLASWSATGTPNWSKAYSPHASNGRLGDAGAYSVAIDEQGNIGVAGFYKGTMSFGGNTFTSAKECVAPDHVADCAKKDPSQRKDSNDAFIAEYTGSGGHVWSKAFGGPAEDRSYAVAFEPNGALVAAGLFTGTVDFGGGPLTNRFQEQLPGGLNYGASWESDIFLVQYSGSGAHQWSKHFVPTGFANNSALPQALTVAPNGDLLLGGSVQRDVDFGGGPLNWSGEAANDDAFVARFTATGAHRWSRRFGTWPYEDRTKGVAVNAAGDVTAVGSWTKQIGPLGPKDESLEDIFVVRLSP